MPLFPPCAPENLSNRRFFDALAGPTWMLNATDFGHLDMLDPEFQQLAAETHLCAVTDGGEAEMDSYRSFVAGETVAFIRGIGKLSS